HVLSLSLHDALPIFTQRRHIFTRITLVDASQTLERLLDVGFAGTARLNTFLECFFQVQASRTTEYHQVKQRVAAQAVGTVYRHASHFTDSKQTFDDLIVAIGVLGDRLTMDVGSHTTHHVVAGRNDRNRCNHRVDMSKGLGQLTDTR